ncbi:MAG: restriction endonuclease subunit R [Muribaculaceae bacterium]|nr:restriction endonuclease subunit R [Muribaculaceae bacterium]
MRYEVLEDVNSSKGSIIVKNPNAVKVQAHRPFEDLMGLVLITNVEKLYDKIDKADDIDNGVFEMLPEKEKKKWMDVMLANELREIIGELPGLCVMIDEVQHAKAEELKIVKVINKWANDSDFNSLLGFSGTPYFSKPETITVAKTLKIKLDMFGNVVTYYPIVKAVGNFLKRPRVKQSDVSSQDIIRNGVKDFLSIFGTTVYPKYGVAKIVIYCDLITRLEEEVYPIVCSICREHGLDPEESILRYYGNNSKTGYKCPPSAQNAFRALDTVHSKHRIILLAQIGKEGWNCKSLTGVILPMPNPSVKNKVLQTTCRCLREVKDASKETAIIWLNSYNYDLLDKELKKNHHSSIEQFSKGKNNKKEIFRYSRQKIVNLPKLHYYQFNVKYSTVKTKEATAETRLSTISPQKFTRQLVSESDFNGNRHVVGQVEIYANPEPMTFNYWLSLISKESLGTIGIKNLRKYTDILRRLFNMVTFEKDGVVYLDSSYKQQTLRSDIRKCFTPAYTIECKEESIPHEASLLKIEPLQRPYFVSEDRKLSPADPEDVKQIIDDDASGIMSADTKKAIEPLRYMGFNDQADKLEATYRNNRNSINNRTYQYIPYAFDSGFEYSYYTGVLKGILKDKEFSDVEIYYNGDESLTGFRINCYAKTSSGWKRIPDYVPDFLILKRNGAGKIAKVIIAETKGKPYQEAFKPKREFMEKFIAINRDADNETRFEFLYLPEGMDETEIYEKTKSKIKNFLNS